MNAEAALKEAYVRDLITIEEFERLITPVLEGKPYSLPYEVAQLQTRFSDVIDDRPGAILRYNPPPIAPQLTAILREHWTADRLQRYHFPR